MHRTAAGLTLTILACQPEPVVAPQPPPQSLGVPSETALAPNPSAPLATEPTAAALATPSPPRCTKADWSARSLKPLLAPGKLRKPAEPGQVGARDPRGPAACGESSTVMSGVEIRSVTTTPDACAFDVRLADGSGPSVRLGPEQIPPRTTISNVLRAGSAAWFEVSFNGYTAEFPKGGNRIVAVDLCDARPMWTSKDSMSNGGLLLLGDYLISAYGFTRERRFVFVQDAHSGSVIQKLPIVENVCPSKSWAPNWHPGERCDAPGQTVGAANDPRVEDGLLWVDTNTGSSTFQFL